MEEQKVVPFGEALTRAFFRRGIPQPWTREKIIKNISECRKDKGYPMFRTAGLKPDQALMVCWGGYGAFPDFISFSGVTPQDKRIMQEHLGEWTIFVDKYGTEEEKIELTRKPFEVFIAKRVIGIDE